MTLTLCPQHLLQIFVSDCGESCNLYTQNSFSQKDILDSYANRSTICIIVSDFLLNNIDLFIWLCGYLLQRTGSSLRHTGSAVALQHVGS